MNNELEAVPPGAEVFEAEGLDRSMKAELLGITLCAPIPAIVLFVWLCQYIIDGMTEKPPVDFRSLAPGVLAGGALVALAVYSALRIYRNAQKQVAPAAQYKHRAVVLTADYLEILTPAMEEHERKYYANMQQLALRLPWNGITQFQVKKIRYKKSPSVRCYVIAAEGLPERFSGEVRVLSKHFRLNEHELLEALSKHLKVGIEDHTQAG